MPYTTEWNLSRYFYSGLDDPRLQSDIEKILPSVKIFANKYKDTFHTFTTVEQILSFYQDYSKLSHNLATPSYYLFYRSSLDTQDQTILKKM